MIVVGVQPFHWLPTGGGKSTFEDGRSFIWGSTHLIQLVRMFEQKLTMRKGWGRD
jgi:hypothetical protein